ncbi:MAG: FAD-dependent oxidoreductase [bacterium]
MASTIVVGGGICGLQLSALLCSDGEEVVVLEKLSRSGGRAYLWKKDGFTMDNGVHLVRFGPESATAQVFRHIGRPLEFTDLGKSFVAFPDGEVVDFPTSPGGFLTTRLMSVSERLKSIPLLLKIKSGPPGSLLETSVEEWMNQNNIKGGLRKYLHLVSASMQVCPFIEKASAGEMLLNMASVLRKKKSVMYPRHGWRYIYETLFDVIGKNGEVRTGTEVKKVLVTEGRAYGVELGSGEELHADRVVINLPCQELFTVLDESLVPEDYALLCKRLRPTAGVVIDYGLERPVSDSAGLWYLWDPMSFGVFTSNLCPELAPAGKQLLTWLLPARVEDMQDPEKAGELEKRLEEAIFRLFPEIKDRQEWRRAMHLSMVDGVEVNVDQHREKRPGCRVPGIEDLFLVGDSLKAPGAGGDIGHESVLECYHELTGRKP